MKSAVRGYIVSIATLKCCTQQDLVLRPKDALSCIDGLMEQAIVYALNKCNRYAFMGDSKQTTNF